MHFLQGEEVSQNVPRASLHRKLSCVPVKASSVSLWTSVKMHGGQEIKVRPAYELYSLLTLRHPYINLKAQRSIYSLAKQFEIAIWWGERFVSNGIAS